MANGSPRASRHPGPARSRNRHPSAGNPWTPSRERFLESPISLAGIQRTDSAQCSHPGNPLLARFIPGRVHRGMKSPPESTVGWLQPRRTARCIAGGDIEDKLARRPPRGWGNAMTHRLVGFGVRSGRGAAEIHPDACSRRDEIASSSLREEPPCPADARCISGADIGENPRRDCSECRSNRAPLTYRRHARTVVRAGLVSDPLT